MYRNIEVAEVVFVGNGADTWYTGTDMLADSNASQVVVLTARPSTSQSP